jgi:hypothetical protein
MQKVLSFLDTVNVACPYLESERWMNFFSSILWTHSSIANFPGLGRLYTFSLMVLGVSSFKGIWWSQAWLGGNLSASFSEKTLTCLWYSGGIGVSVFGLSV